MYSLNEKVLTKQEDRCRRQKGDDSCRGDKIPTRPVLLEKNRYRERNCLHVAGLKEEYSLTVIIPDTYAV